MAPVVRIARRGCSAALRLTGLARPVVRDEQGQAVTEYGIVLGVLIVALATTVVALDSGISAFLGDVVTKVGGIIS